MRLSLKTKFTLTTSLLVLAVVAVVSGLYIARLTRQVLRQADDRAQFVAQQVFLACQNALATAAEGGDSPSSNDPKDMREYVRRTLFYNSTLNSLIESAVGYSPTICEITITDNDGVVLVSSDASLRAQSARRGRERGFACAPQLRLPKLQKLYGPEQTYGTLVAFQSRFRAVRRYSDRPVFRVDP